MTTVTGPALGSKLDAGAPGVEKRSGSSSEKRQSATGTARFRTPRCPFPAPGDAAEEGVPKVTDSDDRDRSGATRISRWHCMTTPYITAERRFSNKTQQIDELWGQILLLQESVELL